jgi:hypothetical protein
MILTSSISASRFAASGLVAQTPYTWVSEGVEVPFSSVSLLWDFLRAALGPAVGPAVPADSQTPEGKFFGWGWFPVKSGVLHAG